MYTSNLTALNEEYVNEIKVYEQKVTKFSAEISQKDIVLEAYRIEVNEHKENSEKYQANLQSAQQGFIKLEG